MLEIFGVEKARPGSTAHLAAFPEWLGTRRDLLNLADFPYPAGVWTGATEGRVLLMVENAETFCVMRECLKDRAHPDVCALVFGGGNALATPLDASFDLLLYFGDWDPSGVATLARLAARDNRVRPWNRAYRQLLKFSRIPRYSPRARSLTPAALDRLFPPDLASAAVRLCDDACLIPQEWLGFAEVEALLAEPTLD